MPDLIADYAAKRARAVAQVPPLAGLLPEESPPRPVITALGPRSLVRLVGEAGNNHAALVMVVGWGDGQVVRTLLEDPLVRQKQIHVVVFRGEEPALAWSIFGPDAFSVDGAVKITRVHSEETLQDAVHTSYGGHEDIPVLAGADFIDAHPLAEAAEAERRRWLPRLYTMLGDRPQAYGNDIVDSYTGLHQSAENARQLLPAPSIGEMHAFFGQAPAISIAAGPSLHRHLDRLRQLQDRCVLVCCDAVLHGLLDAGIVPHFVTPLERVPSILPMISRAGECPTIFAGLPVCPPTGVRAFGVDRSLGLYCGDKLYDWLCPEPGPRIDTGLSTGTLSVSVAGALTAGPVFLVGHDLSRDETGTHWDGAQYAGDDWARVRAKAIGERSYGSGYEERLIPGNDGGLVRSIAWWDRFRDDISVMTLRLRDEDRHVYNVNAHERICAHIPHTEAAPLPNPDALPPLAPWRLPARNEARFRDWARRARGLPADCEAFASHLRSLRDDLAASRRRPPATWRPADLAKRLDLMAAVSDGNRMAFAYFLRSALHNVNAEMHLRRRTGATARSRWEMLRSMEDLCEALLNALDHLRPGFTEIADEHARDS